MTKFLIAGLLFALAQPANAQHDDHAEVYAFPGAQGVLVTRVLEIPDQIGFAVVPYAECLFSGIRDLQDQDIILSEHPERVGWIKEQCRGERERTIFLAATALERINDGEIDVRQALIFDTLAALEAHTFDPPDIDALSGASSE